MNLRWLLAKSDGVLVSGRVYRLIHRGNAARDAAQWGAAADAYRAVLAKNPRLAHIWVQLGHAAKEFGDLDDAETAYRRAASLRPNRAEPLIHIGHVSMLRGSFGSAAQAYLDALHAEPSSGEPLEALSHLITRFGNALDPATLTTLRTNFIESEKAVGAVRGSGSVQRQTTDGGAATMVFDVSDLVGYWSHRQSPTGIQRVQIEIIDGMLELPARDDVRICTFVEKLDDWYEIPPPLFRHICELSRSAGGATWRTEFMRFLLRLGMVEPFRFPHGALLINLGTSWWLTNYFDQLRRIRVAHAVRYVPFVHDLIPIVAPEHCLEELKIAFRRWIDGVFAHADHFLVNSQATRRDLLRVANSAGNPIDAASVDVVRLDGYAPASPVQSPPVAGPYVLFVSTIESRKGHVVALDAWRDLIARHGPARVPRLVLVGRRGWLNAAVYQRIADHPELARGVEILSDVPDAALSALYRGCLFTIYPSLYEGWGMPITEALGFGKVVIASSSSSLPEAGGNLAIYVEPGSATDLAAAAERMIFDTSRRQELESRIAAEHRPRRWSEVAADLAGMLRLWRADAHPSAG